MCVFLLKELPRPSPCDVILVEPIAHRSPGLLPHTQCKDLQCRFYITAKDELLPFYISYRLGTNIEVQNNANELFFLDPFLCHNAHYHVSCIICTITYSHVFMHHRFCSLPCILYLSCGQSCILYSHVFMHV